MALPNMRVSILSAAIMGLVVRSCFGFDWSGVVLHEVPEYYESDGVTIKKSSGKMPLRLLTPRPQTGGISDAMGQLVPAFKLALKEINSGTKILQDYIVELHLIESACSEHVGLQNIIKALVEKPMGYYKMLYGPACSGPTMLVNDAIQPLHLFQVNPLSRASALSVDARYPNLCRTSPPLSFLVVGMKRLVALFGWRRMIVVDDGTALAKGTATLVIRSMETSKADYDAAHGQVSACAEFDCYDFDQEYIAANRYTLGASLDETNDVVDEAYVLQKATLSLSAGDTRILAFNGYESSALRFFCGVYRSKLYEQFVIISPTGWWGSSWVQSQLDLQTVEKDGEFAGCTFDEVNRAAQNLISFEQLSYYSSDFLRHGVTDQILNEIKNSYLAACPREGCHWSFSPYEYDGLASVAQMFHTWIYDHGNDLSYLNLNSTAARELYNVMLGTAFLGVTGQVEFYNSEGLNCERKGAFSVRQWRDGGWVDIASYLHESGFATMIGAEWSPIHWYDGKTYFGSGSGWVATEAGKPATFGIDAIGLDEVPADRLFRVSCAAGQRPDATLLSCEDCDAGRFGENNECHDCSSGRFADSPGMSSCEKCSAGKFVSAVAATACIACRPGQHTEGSNGYDQCFDCPKGKFSEQGEGECTYCPQGTYADKTGTGHSQHSSSSDPCQSCDANLDTRFPGATSSEECVCAEGSYEALHINDCKTCPEKMICETGSKEANIGTKMSAPQVNYGYWTSEEAPLSVFICQSGRDCPGGSPNSCSGSLTGHACARCPDGTTMLIVSDGHECEDCGAKSIARLVGLIIGAFFGCLGLAVVHVYVNRPPISNKRSYMIGVFLGGMAITAMLTLNIYSGLDAIWGPPLTSFFEFVKIFKLDIQAIGFSCIVGTDTRVGKYVGKLLCVPLAFVFLLAGLIFLHSFPSLRPVTSINKVGLVNTMGLICSVFFIAMCNISLEGFNCTENPNGKQSMTSDRSIICWDGAEHLSYVILSVVALLIYPVAFLSSTGFVAYNYDKLAIRIGHSFSKGTQFLSARMDLDRIFFGFLYNMRNFILALMPVVFSSKFSLQVLGLVSVFVGWLVIQMHFQPWRFEVLNSFDAFSSAGNILLLVCFAMLGGYDNFSSEEIGWFIIAIFLGFVTTLITAAVSRMLMPFLRKKEYGVFLCHAKLSAGLFVRQVKVMLQAVTPRKVFLDTDDLANLDNLNFMVRAQTDNLVVLVTKDVFTRFWCATEIVSAYANKVRIVAVQVTASVADVLTDDFVENVEKLWGPFEHMQFSKLGLSVIDVQAAFKHVRELAPSDLRFTASFKDQFNGTKELVSKMVDCPLAQKHHAAEAYQTTVIIYDTRSPEQSCVARIMHLALERARWSSQLISQETEVLELSATALVLMSANLIKNPVSVGFITLMSKKHVHMVTVLSQEAFPDLDKTYLKKLKNGTALSTEDEDTMSKITNATRGFVAEALESLYKILAMPFNPQESEDHLKVELQRITQRTKALMLRTSSYDSNKDADDTSKQSSQDDSTADEMVVSRGKTQDVMV